MSEEQSPSQPGAAAKRVGIPTTSDEVGQLLEARPPAWEYLLFAGLLLQGRDRLEARWRDHQLHIPTGEYRRLTEDEVASYMSEAIGRLIWLLEPTSRVFEAQEDAFGRPGESGNPVLIQHLADWVIGLYDKLLDWAGTVRSGDPPDEFAESFSLLACAVDLPIDRVRQFLDETVEETGKISAHLAKPEGERGQLRIETSLILDADEELLTRAINEMGRALGQEDVADPDG